VLKPTVALILNTYDQPDYLARVLRAISAQHDVPDEVLLADDGSGVETRRVFEQWAAAQPRLTRHVWHEKDGFRRARILNKTIASARSDYVIFLDGDSIPHPRFVADHRALAQPFHFIQGRRVLVKQEASLTFGSGDFSRDRLKAFLAGQLKGRKHVFRWPIAFKWVVPNLRGVLGCNLSAWRSDLFKVNGYDEDYTGWGCEDVDLALRLINSGVRRLDVRGWALCYHLWHPPADRSNLISNQAKLEATKSKGLVRCESGLNRHCSV
jgi:glycosyltransferase involved in cell wall biosynthesis